MNPLFLFHGPCKQISPCFCSKRLILESVQAMKGKEPTSFPRKPVKPMRYYPSRFSSVYQLCPSGLKKYTLGFYLSFSYHCIMGSGSAISLTSATYRIDCFGSLPSTDLNSSKTSPGTGTKRISAQGYHLPPLPLVSGSVTLATPCGA